MAHHCDWPWQPTDVPHGQVRVSSYWPQAAQARPGVPDGRPRARCGDERDQAGNLCGQSGRADSWPLQHHHGAGPGHRHHSSILCAHRAERWLFLSAAKGGGTSSHSLKACGCPCRVFFMARVTENNTAETGIIREEDFSVIMAQAFATYGLSVVTDRALPDARDGLKPVQRRILAGMLQARYLSSHPTVKSAEVVGLILGNYHPHGDSSVYDAAARMTQPFTMRYPLIEGQGNMGSEDGDSPAAYRYTEMRLSPLAEALMADMERETVPLHPTYKQDPKVLEPDYLPGRIPPVVNPSSGIAVGLSTNIPPHNLTEVLRACIALLDRPKINVEQLMTYIKGPDFCQGGRIMGIEGIKDYLTTGKGRIVVRAEVRLEETPRSRLLIVTQLPPIGRDKVKASIVKAINARKLEGLLPDLRDESDTEKGTRIVLELRKDADAAQVLSQLFNETDLQIAQSFQMVFLFGEPMQAARHPKQVGMIELLNYWNAHQVDVVTRRAQFDLRKARERLHVVEGLIVGAANADRIVKIFQQAEDRALARKKI